MPAPDAAQREAFAVIGKEINLGSPKQLQTVLFETLGMPKTKKTKTGYTTDAAALEALPADAIAKAFIEVAGPDDEVPMNVPAGVQVTWVHRGGHRSGRPRTDGHSGPQSDGFSETRLRKSRRAFRR